MSSILLVIIGFAAGALVTLLYYELRNQKHMWSEPCATPLEDQADIRVVARHLRDAMDRHGVRWWLDYGTLLGAWRIGECLPYDHDLDMSYLAEDLAKLEPALPELEALGVGLELEHGRIFYGGRKIGDLEAWHRFGNRLCRDDPDKRTDIMRFWRPQVDDLNADWVLPLAEIKFCGEWYKSPRQVKRFLRHRYIMCRLHLRMTIPHKQRCWICAAFWRWAWKIWTCRDFPQVRG